MAGLEVMEVILSLPKSQGLIVAKPSKQDIVVEPVDEKAPVTKGHATPTRKEREAANLRPLVTKGRGTSPQSRAAANAQRDRARAGMAAGEEKYLPAKDKGPQRRFVRDYVDARWSVGELLIPFLVIMIILSLFGSSLTAVTTYALYAYIVVLLLDVVVLGFSLQRKLAAKFGVDKVQKGFRFYAAMRSVQLRPMRLPKPQIKRGAFPS